MSEKEQGSSASDERESEMRQMLERMKVALGQPNADKLLTLVWFAADQMTFNGVPAEELRRMFNAVVSEVVIDVRHGRSLMDALDKAKELH